MKRCHHPKAFIYPFTGGWKWCSYCGATRWTREHWRRPVLAIIYEPRRYTRPTTHTPK